MVEVVGFILVDLQLLEEMVVVVMVDLVHLMEGLVVLLTLEVEEAVAPKTIKVELEAQELL